MKKGAKKWFIPLTAAAFSAGLSMVSLAAGWSQENGEWYYYTSDGGKETDAFRRSGNNWFYLGSDGTMVKSSIVEQDGNYYYVNSAGAMVSRLTARSTPTNSSPPASTRGPDPAPLCWPEVKNL